MSGNTVLVAIAVAAIVLPWCGFLWKLHRAVEETLAGMRWLLKIHGYKPGEVAPVHPFVERRRGNVPGT